MIKLVAMAAVLALAGVAAAAIKGRAEPLKPGRWTCFLPTAAMMLERLMAASSGPPVRVIASRSR